MHEKRRQSSPFASNTIFFLYLMNQVESVTMLPASSS